MSCKPIILVTGGNQGIGFECLKALARTKKYHLIVATRSQEKTDAAISTLSSETGTSSTDFTGVVISLESDSQIQAAATLIEQKFGYLDVLVNNAAINTSPDPNATLRENWKAVFDVNVFGVAVMNEAFKPLLKRSTFPQRRIVTVTSGLGMFGVATTPHSPFCIWKFPVAPQYRASKAAVNMAAAFESVGEEGENLPTVLVCPGYCRTAFGDFNGDKDPDAGGRVVARAATEGDNKDLYLKIVDDEGKFAEFGW